MRRSRKRRRHVTFSAKNEVERRWSTTEQNEQYILTISLRNCRFTVPQTIAEFNL